MKTSEALAVLDRASLPLRDAIQLWMRERKLGSTSYFDSRRQLWVFDIYKVFIVEVDEDGKGTRVMVGNATVAKATTPTGLRRAMNRLWSG